MVALPAPHGERGLADPPPSSDPCLTFTTTLYEKTISLLNLESTVVVIVVPVAYSVTIDVVLQVSLQGKLCIADQQASVGVVPDAKVVTAATAAIDVFIAQAGITLTGTIMDTSLLPVLTVTVASGGTISKGP